MNAEHKWIWQQVTWPQFTWQGAEFAQLLREINQLQGKLLGRSAIVEGSESLKSEMDALLQNAINTSAIEGEQLNVDSVRSSLARRLGIDQAGLTPGTPQTDGLADLLLDATRNPDEVLSLKRLFHWHAALFPHGGGVLTQIRVGELRGDDLMQVVSGPIGKPKVHFEAPPRDGLQQELDQFVAWFNQTRDNVELDPLVRAGIAHLWFVTLHPFDDGNGRLARAITDLALAQAEHQSVRFYAMSATIMEHRKAYYDILEKTQRDGMDVTLWLVWFLSMLKHTLLAADQRIVHVLQKAKFWQQHTQIVLNERQIKVLNRLLDAGPDGFEGGINARKYVSLTEVSKATATRDLAELVEKGCLVQRAGGGRSTSYDINWV
jgi:Fic family protein